MQSVYKLINWTFSDLWEMILFSFLRRSEDQILFLDTEWILIAHIESTKIYTAICRTLKLVLYDIITCYIYIYIFVLFRMNYYAIYI